MRGLAASFRTPYPSARVVDDTNRRADVEVAAADVEKQVFG